MLDSGALQPRKWQLLGTGCSTAAQANGNGLLDPQYAASMHTTSQSTTLDLHPVIRIRNYMDRYSFTDPSRDGLLSWPCWLTDSGRLLPKSGRPFSLQSGA